LTKILRQMKILRDHEAMLIRPFFSPVPEGQGLRESLLPQGMVVAGAAGSVAVAFPGATATVKVKSARGGTVPPARRPWVAMRAGGNWRTR
jgi:hypothetical protein